jgi:hypothetical protein
MTFMINPVKIDQRTLTLMGLNYAIRRTFLDQVGGSDLKSGTRRQKSFCLTKNS